MLRDSWAEHAEEWVAWARAPGHDSYWRFHRDVFFSLVPPPGRLTAYVGWGAGRGARDLSRLGHRVVALDASEEMVGAAASHPEGRAALAVADAALLPLVEGAADCVVAFMCLQDVDAMEAAVAEAARVLVPGGCLVLAITHPANTAGRFAPGPEEDNRPFVIEGSWFERRPLRDTCERGGYTMTFHSEHRPLHDYVDALADAGFLIERLKEVREPDPADKWYRMPLFLHVRAVRV